MLSRRMSGDMSLSAGLGVLTLCSRGAESTSEPLSVGSPSRKGGVRRESFRERMRVLSGSSLTSDQRMRVQEREPEMAAHEISLRSSS